jgi:hypothetical protein
MKILALLVLVVAASGCGESGNDFGASYDLSVLGSGFGADDGRVLYFAVARTDTGTIVATDTTTVRAGAFELSFGSLLDRGLAYEADYYVDVNGNGRCDAPPTDHVWREAIAAVQANTSLQVSGSSAYDSSACSAF